MWTMPSFQVCWGEKGSSFRMVCQKIFPNQFFHALNIHWPDPSLMGTAKANTNNKSFDSSGSNESEWILESLMSWSGIPK